MNSDDLSQSSAPLSKQRLVSASSMASVTYLVSYAPDYPPLTPQNREKVGMLIQIELYPTSKVQIQEK